MTTQEILNAIQKGNKDVFELIYTRNWDRIVRFITRRGGKLHDAEDAFQEAIAEIFEKVHLNHPIEIKSDFHSYFFSVVKNKWLYQLRKMNLKADSPKQMGFWESIRSLFSEKRTVLMTESNEPMRFKTLRFSNYDAQEATTFQENLPSSYVALLPKEIHEKHREELAFEIMEEVLETLSEECQKVIEAFYKLCEKMSEIEQQMGYAAGFGKVKKKRCMDNFKKKVEAHPDYLKATDG